MPHINLALRWRREIESANDLAERFTCFFDMLSSIDPIAGRWRRNGERHRSGVPRDISRPTSVAEFREWIAESPRFTARDGCKTFDGWSVEAYAHGEDDSAACMSLCVRRFGGGDAERTRFRLWYSGNAVERIALCSRVLMLDAIEAWQPDWARYSTGAYMPDDFKADVPLLCEPGWFIYLASSLAHHAERTSGLSIGRLSEGGLLLSAPSASQRT
jgi:hypothetical protein